MAKPVGVFAPGSVSRLLHADPAMWLAGVRSLYLEALHPRAVRGVLQNSTFRQDPAGRLFRTARFVATVTFGSAEEAEHAASRVRRIHAALWGFDPDTGEKFPLDAPGLLLWIHCASTASYLDVVRRSGLPISDSMADRYVDEQRWAAELIGLRAADVPKSTAEMADYFTDLRPHLRITPEAAEIYAFLSRPSAPAWFARRTRSVAPVAGVAYQTTRAFLWGPLAHVAYSALPPWAISLYGHRAHSAENTTRALRSLRNAALAVPSAVRDQVVRL